MTLTTKSASVPVVEIPNHAHTLRRGCPDGEMNAGNVSDVFHVRAEFFVHIVVRALVEEVNIHLAENRRKGVGIALPPFRAIMPSEIKGVGHAFLESHDLALE